MKICVLQPSYKGSASDYQHYDPRRDLSALLPDHTFHHAFLDKVSTFGQVRALVRDGYDVFVNLCEGYRDSDVPSIDVIQALEYFNVPFTGPTSALYDPPKDLMKVAARSAGVLVPPSVVLDGAAADGSPAPWAGLRFPLFVKPAEFGDSMGIDAGARVGDEAALLRQVAAVAREYGRVLVEEYIDGREFTVLVYAAGDERRTLRSLTPVEFLFPAGHAFKTYDLKVTQFHPECNVPVRDEPLAARLRDAALAIVRAFAADGYARLDFRMAPDGRLFFLEINFTCSVFYPDGYYGSADYILAFDGLGQAGFLQAILDEALARHARRQLPYTVRSRDGVYGMYASRRLRAGDTVFRGEEQPQRIVTRAHVERTWSPEDREIFYRYAYPVGPDVFVLWDLDPARWAPQNHACEPNTAFRGLDVVTLRDVEAGEELTLDYGVCYDSRMIPFDCTCGSPRCRGRITGGQGLWGSGSPSPHP